MNERRGMELLRVLDDDEKRLLRASFAACKDGMPAGARAIHWVNLYLNGKLTVDHPWRDALHRWVTETVAEVYSDWPERHVLNYQFIVNPAGNPDGQPFHCDYSGTSSNLFVPLTRVSLRNSTQFIRQPLQRARLDHKSELGSLEDIIEAEGCDAIEVTQLVCRPFSLLRLHPGTPHRGTGNGDDQDRVLFCVTVDDHPHDLAETVYFEYSESAYKPVPQGDAQDRHLKEG